MGFYKAVQQKTAKVLTFIANSELWYGMEKAPAYVVVKKAKNPYPRINRDAR